MIQMPILIMLFILQALEYLHGKALHGKAVPLYIIENT